MPPPLRRSHLPPERREGPVRPCLQEWLPPDHLAYCISDMVDQLDISEITARCVEQRGGPPYDPRMMVSGTLLHRCDTGSHSSDHNTGVHPRRCSRDNTGPGMNPGSMASMSYGTATGRKGVR